MEDFIVNASGQTCMCKLQELHACGNCYMLAMQDDNVPISETRLLSKDPDRSTGTPRSVVCCQRRVFAGCLWPCLRPSLQWAEWHRRSVSTLRPARIVKSGLEAYFDPH
jgi:hypothetical protein